MRDEKADNKWRVLDDLGKHLTKCLELVEKTQAHRTVDYFFQRETKEGLLQAKEFVNQLKSLMIKEVSNPKSE